MELNGLTYEQIVNQAAGVTSGEEAQRIAARIAQSPDAQRILAIYHAARHAVAADDGAEPSASALAAARAVFKREALAVPQPGSTWWQAIERVVAALVFDSRVQTAGVRSAATSSFTISYGSERADLDLQFDPVHGGDDDAANRWRLRGQASADDESDVAEVVVAACGAVEPLARMQADRHGRFEVEVQSGQYDVYVLLGRTVMVANDVKVP